MEFTYGELSNADSFLNEDERFLHQTHTFEQFKSILKVVNQKHELRLPIEEDVLRFLYWQLDGNVVMLFRTLVSLYNRFKYEIRDSYITPFGAVEMRQWFNTENYLERMKLTWYDIGPWQNEVSFGYDGEELAKFRKAIKNEDLSEFLPKLPKYHRMKLWTTISASGKPKFCPLFQKLYENFYSK